MFKRLNGLALLLGLLAVSACSFLDFGGSDNFTRADLEAFIGAPLPAGTMDLRYETQAGIDRIVIARFSAPADEIDGFVTALGFAEPPVGGGSTSLGPGISPAPEWWQSGNLTATISRVERIGNRNYWIMIEDSAAAMREVYLQVFTM